MTAFSAKHSLNSFSWGFLLALMFIALPGVMLAQKNEKRAQGKPEHLDPPVDFFYDEQLYVDYISNQSRGSKSSPWLVFSDRSNNYTYDRPGGEILKRMEFREWFYVVDENEEWVEIVRSASQDELKLIGEQEYMGWVPKKMMLLWSEGLVHDRTEIHQKAFLLNKAEDILDIFQLEEKDRVAVYDSPEGQTTTDPINIYRNFFVFKKENRRYLLGEQVTIHPSNVGVRLIGWIDEDRCEDWNTRIAFEPNFLPAAYYERANNTDKFRVVAYDARESAKLHADAGIISENQVLWDNEPCVADSSMVSTLNTYRFKGDVIRFPMLTGLQFKDVISTGIVGDIIVSDEKTGLDTIPESQYTTVKSRSRRDAESSGNFNVMFLVEGTAPMAKYKESIRTLAGQTKERLAHFRSVRVGLTVYRDIPERQVGKDIEVFPLSHSQEEYEQFVENLDFTNWYDEDPWTNLYDGVFHALVEADFNPDETNIIVVLGQNADFSRSRARKGGAVESGDPAYHKPEDIIDLMMQLDVFPFFIQCSNQSDAPSAYFKRSSDNFILELAKSHYNDYAPVADSLGIKVVQPYRTQDDAVGMFELDYSQASLPGFSYAPDQLSILTSAEVNLYTMSVLEKTQQFIAGINEILSQTIDQGKAYNASSASAGNWNPAMARYLTKIIRKEGRSLSQDNMQKIMKTKYQLFKEVYIPYQISGAQHPTLSYVLFMPQSDLLRYIERLKRVEDAGNAASDITKREQLFNAFYELIQLFAGQEQTDQDVEGMYLSEFQALMNGLEKEGLNLPSTQNFLIGDILDDDKMSPEQINEIIKRVTRKLDNLESIARQGRDYEFAFNAGNDVYFWITLDESF